ncbi:MAG: hypothetical protein OK436_05990 [Thaumarchaeota archaeon]|nr:hypothetical protein [Nitrososphaerota archaeon]
MSDDLVRYKGYKVPAHLVPESDQRPIRREMDHCCIYGGQNLGAALRRTLPAFCDDCRRKLDGFEAFLEQFRGKYLVVEHGEPE